MCFTVSVFANTHQIEIDLGATFDDAAAYQPYFHVSGFVHPHLPVVTNDRPDRIELMRWGLIPSWVKDRAKADELASMTLNAKSETVFEKPSFRSAIAKRRALLAVNGFVEWRHEGTQKIPHLIRMQHHEIFTLGCLWEQWADRESGEVLRTFSIVTTEANELMSYVHNNKQRMPVVIPQGSRTAWLQADDRETATMLMRPLPEGLLTATPLSREVSRIKVNVDHHELLEPTGPSIT